MKRVLLVDDDPIVIRIYREGLSQHGMQVDTAADGVAAITSLRAGKPDAVVLDLMMPRLTGVDVLKFIRSEANLKDLPVVVLSNSYMTQLAAEASALGAQEALLKVRCSPSHLLKVLEEVMAGKSSDEEPSELLAVPVQSPPVPPTPADEGLSGPAAPAPTPGEAKEAAELQAEARRSFLQDTRATCSVMRGLYKAVITAPNDAEREPRLRSFYRKVHSITANAGLAECHHLAQMASVFEALLFELIDNPNALSPSVLRTIAATVDLLTLLFDCAHDPDGDAPLSAQVLVVDDDPMSNRLVVAALDRAHLHARSTHDPLMALQRLKETHFDLVMLDIEMPGVDGFELCRRLRKLPGYLDIPVIYVTGHSYFENRVKGILSGGDDLIAKPIFSSELAVKAIAHLLKREISA